MKSNRDLLILPIACAFAFAFACGGSSATTVEQPSAADGKDEAAKARVAVSPIPDGYRAITPVIVVGEIDQALAFYAEALGATTRLTLPGPGGKTMHAEITIGDSTIMIGAEDESENSNGAKSPTTLGGANGSLLLYVEDVDAAVSTAVDAGATLAMPAEDMFWGDRYASVVDPFGHQWGIATHKEDVGAAEMEKRIAAWRAAAMKGKKYAPPTAATPAKSWQPDGYGTVTVALLIKGGADDVAFYEKALGATVISKMPMPDGKLMHAALKIGDSIIHLSSEFPETPTHKAAANLGGSPVSVHFYTPDVDAATARAVAAGATAAVPVSDMVWGDRWGAVVDPAGNHWGIATHIEDLEPDEILARMKAQAGGAK